MRPAYCGPTSQKMQLDVCQVKKTFAWLARLPLLSAFLRAIKVIDCLTDVLVDLSIDSSINKVIDTICILIKG